MTSQNLKLAISISDFLVLLVGAVTLFCVLSGTAWMNRAKTRDRSKTDSDDGDIEYPPTPPDKHWLLGHALHLNPSNLGVPKESSHDVIFGAWLPKLKSKVVMFELPVIGRFIVVGDAAVAKHVLNTKNKENNSIVPFPKSPTYKSIFSLTGRKSILVTEGTEWQSQRRLYNPGFTPEYLKSIVSIIAEKCDRFVAACEREDVNHGLPTNMWERAIDLTSDVIAQVAFGEDWGNYSEHTSENSDNKRDADYEIRKCGIQTLDKSRKLATIIGLNMKEPLQRFFNFFRMYRSWRLSVSLDRDIQGLVQRRLDRMSHMEESKQSENDSQTKSKDILSMTLSNFLRESSDKSASFSSDDMEHVTAQLKTFYFAGHDTTATTIAWAYWLLVQHPEKLEKARQEVSDHIGHEWTENVLGSGKNLKDGLTYEKLQQCSYLDCVARETLRLYPPASTTRYATDPAAKYGKYKLGDSRVHINIYAIQRDPDLWGEDANDFVPERFLGENGRKLVSSHIFLPFSKGPRDCIGKYFALLEAKIALAVLITRFDGVAVDAEKEVYMATLTSLPMNGCKVKLSRRV